MNTVWVLTREINEYNQDGEYFVAVFTNRPHHSLLTKHGVPQDRLHHVGMKGGGRIGDEDEWFLLREVAPE